MSEPPHIENFEIVGCLGQGGMATVWKARQASLDRLVAIKVLAPHFATEASDIARFCEEARAAGRLKHPGIVQVYDANFRDGSYYFVMELVDGCTVGEWIRRKGKLTEQDALTVAESVAVALDYAATGFGIIHCDIKPENIMVDADGTLKITDLGLSRAISVMKGAPAEEILGTPAYMAPEQVRGETDLDGRVDIYALGATLYHMVTGHTLFAGGSVDETMQSQLASSVPSPSREVAGLSRGFVMLLAQMLAKDRKYRPADWKSVLVNVRRVRGHHMPLGEVPPPGASTLFVGSDGIETVKRQAAQALAEAERRDERRSHGIVWLVAGLAAVAAALAVWAMVSGAPAPAPRPPAGRAAPTEAERQLQEARAYVAEHPRDFAGGRARLQEVIDACGDAACVDRARDDLSRLQVRHGQDVQATREMPDKACRDLIAAEQREDAVRMLEQYRGRNETETAEWRRQHAAEIRAAAPRTRPPDDTVAPPATPPPATPPALTPDKALRRAATVLLRQGAAEAERILRNLGSAPAEVASDGRIAALRDLVEEAVGVERDLLETYRRQKGQRVAVSLTTGTVRGTVRNVNQKVHLALDDGSERAFGVDDLDVQERLRLLGRNDSAGATLLKTVWAYRSHATDRARTFAAQLPAPAGAAVAAAMDAAAAP
jgi:serine/threonine-protein kinase